MGLFDSLIKSIKKTIKAETTNVVNEAISSIGKGTNRTERFTFSTLPSSLAELKAMPEASLDSAFKTTALTIAVLCSYEKNPDACFEMLNFLKGPAQLSTPEKDFIKERLKGKIYKTFSFFEGATLYVTSSGADNSRPIKLRKKPSTRQWFLNEIQCLSDIRIPVKDDP